MTATNVRKQAISAIASTKVTALSVDPEAPTPEALFASNVFGLAAMKTHLPKEVFKSLKRTIDRGEPLNPAIADTVAAAMKDWAVAKGATHFAHIFYPLTGATADSSGERSLFASVRRAMAKCGYSTVKEFQRADLILAHPRH